MSDALHPDELLPWYANGTLPPEKRDEIAAHLRGCDRCRGELAFLAGLRERVKASAAATGPDEVGLERLLRETRRAPRVPGIAWLRPALAAAVAVVVVQAALVAWLWTREPLIEPLGGPRREGVVLQVRFDPAAPEARIRALLQKNDATLIDGPGALGVYRVRLQNVKPGDAAALAKALDDFRRTKGVVTQAEAEQ